MADLIVKARDLQREYEGLYHKLMETGKLDQGNIDRMQVIRHEILSSPANSAMDQLMQIGVIKSVAGFLFEATATTQAGDDPNAAMAMVHESLAEILLGLNTMAPTMEAQAGHTLADLGLFVNGNSLN